MISPEELITKGNQWHIRLMSTDLYYVYCSQLLLFPQDQLWLLPTEVKTVSQIGF